MQGLEAHKCDTELGMPLSRCFLGLKTPLLIITRGVPSRSTDHPAVQGSGRPLLQFRDKYRAERQLLRHRQRHALPCLAASRLPWILSRTGPACRRICFTTGANTVRSTCLEWREGGRELGPVFCCQSRVPHCEDQPVAGVRIVDEKVKSHAG